MNICQPLRMQRRQKLFIYFIQVGPALCTYSHVKFRHVSVAAATLIIGEDNATD